MNTSKLLIGLTLIFVTLLTLGGLFITDSLLMAFAGVGAGYTIVRLGVIVLLISLLLTKPPRSKLLRAMLATWSVALIVLSGQLLMSYQLFALDAVLFVEVALIFAIEALEAQLQPAKAAKSIKIRKNIPVVSASTN